MPVREGFASYACGGCSIAAAVGAACLRIVCAVDGGEGRFLFAPSLLEDLREKFGGLRARDAVLLVDDEEGDAGGAERGGLGLVGADGLSVGGGVVEDGHDLVLVEPGGDGDFDDALAFVDGGLVGEVRDVEGLPGLGFQAAFGGEVQQPVQVEGVAVVAALGPVGEAFGLGEVAELVFVGLGLGVADAVLLGDHGYDGVHVAGLAVRVELERAVPHLDLDLAVELLHGLVEAGLPHVAPRAGDIGPDVHTKLCHLSPNT